MHKIFILKGSALAGEFHPDQHVSHLLGVCLNGSPNFLFASLLIGYSIKLKAAPAIT
jgi:hypothetical protein